MRYFETQSTLGWVVIKDSDTLELISAIHEPIVSQELFQKVQKLLIQSKQKHRGCIKKEFEWPEMPLRGFLQCPLCDHKLTGSGSVSNGGKYFYYHCQNGCKTRIRAEEANEAFIAYLNSFRVRPEVAELYMAIIEDTFKLKEGDRDREIINTKKEIETLDGKLLKIDQKYVDEQLDHDSYRRLKTHTAHQIRIFQDKIGQLQNVDSNYMKYCRFGMNLLMNLDACYEQASLEFKRKLIGSIFTEKLVFEHGSYRTTKMNEAVELIGQFQRELDEKKDGRSSFLGKTSDHVPL